MGWAKFDDQYSDHPKVVAAGALAELLDMRAVIYCARYETDGLVLAEQLPRISVGIPAPKKKAAKLVEVGRWLEHPDGWVVHDFLDYHPAREEQEAKRAEARERMAKNRAKKGRSSRDVRANERANNERSSPYPDPVPGPEPQEGQEREPSRKRSDRAHRLPDGWKPDPEPELVASLGGQHLAKREFDKFCDYWKAQGGARGRKVDWQATWRNWLRRASESTSTRNGQARGVDTHGDGIVT